MQYALFHHLRTPPLASPIAAVPTHPCSLLRHPSRPPPSVSRDHPVSRSRHGCPVTCPPTSAPVAAVPLEGYCSPGMAPGIAQVPRGWSAGVPGLPWVSSVSESKGKGFVRRWGGGSPSAVYRMAPHCTRIRQKAVPSITPPPDAL